jgi:hypothetical protein
LTGAWMQRAPAEVRWRMSARGLGICGRPCVGCARRWGSIVHSTVMRCCGIWCWPGSLSRPARPTPCGCSPRPESSQCPYRTVKRRLPLIAKPVVRQAVSAACAAHAGLRSASDYQACSDKNRPGAAVRVSPQRGASVFGLPHSAGLPGMARQRAAHDADGSSKSQHLRTVVDHALAVSRPGSCLACRPAGPLHTAGKLHS